METLSNSVLTVQIAEHGAELQSIKKDGKEYLWQGDAKFWGRRSPVLFPIVGRVWNNKYRHAGNTYEIGQHGFARDMNFGNYILIYTNYVKTLHYICILCKKLLY